MFRASAFELSMGACATWQNNRSSFDSSSCFVRYLSFILLDVYLGSDLRIMGC